MRCEDDTRFYRQRVTWAPEAFAAAFTPVI
jgi:hypothetical protein